MCTGRLCPVHREFAPLTRCPCRCEGPRTALRRKCGVRAVPAPNSVQVRPKERHLHHTNPERSAFHAEWRGESEFWGLVARPRAAQGVNLWVVNLSGDGRARQGDGRKGSNTRLDIVPLHASHAPLRRRGEINNQIIVALYWGGMFGVIGCALVG